MPVDKAAYHVPVFRNDLIAVLRVNIPSHRSAGYHIHSLDQISVLVEEADQSGQVLGEQPRASLAGEALLPHPPHGEQREAREREA